MPITDHDPESNDISNPILPPEGAASRPDQPLTRYEAARAALAEASRIDEVKDIRDKAVALKAYAHQAKDTELVEHATAIKLYAERRAGKLLAEMEKNKGGGEPGVGRAGKNAVPSGNRIIAPPTLAEIGVSKKQSSKWQQLAELPEDKFEAEVEYAKARAKGAITNASGAPESRRASASPKSKSGAEPASKPSKAPLAPPVDEIDMVVGEILKQCADGRWRPVDKIASAIRRAPSGVRQALIRLGDSVNQRNTGTAIEFRILPESEAHLRRELADARAEIADLKQTIAELERLLEQATTPPSAAPSPVATREEALQ